MVENVTARAPRLRERDDVPFELLTASTGVVKGAAPTWRVAFLQREI